MLAKTVRVLGPLAIVLAVVSCDAGSFLEPATVEVVTVNPASDTILVAGTLQLEVSARDAQGDLVTPDTIVWASSDTSVASVDGSGLVIGRKEGDIDVSVTFNGVSDIARVMVASSASGSLTISPADTLYGIGDTTTLTVSAVAADGSPITEPDVQWRSSNPDIATVDSMGLVTARAIGIATIAASATLYAGDFQAIVVIDDAKLADECSNPGSGWIWCDDFDQDRLASYFEFSDAAGSFARTADVGVDGSSAMRVEFDQGQVDAGSLKLAFGATPDAHMDPVDDGTAKYRDVYWRFYVRNASNWAGGGGEKLTRATSFAQADWSQAMIAHLWSGGANEHYLVADPASGTDEQGNLQTAGYNDFANLRWLGANTGSTPIFDGDHVGQWYCVETHVRLNDAGQSNGVFEFWVDDQSEARKTGLNWVGDYDAYGINAIFLENYWNGGSPQAQERYIDNFVVSTQRIGCGKAPATGSDKALIDIDFEQYGSTAEMLNDCTTWGGCIADKSTERIALDSTVAPPGQSRSMRYDYRHSGDGCNSSTIKRSVRFEPKQEVWAEFKLRYSTNFSTNNSACYPNDHKLIFGDTKAPLNGRWDFRIGTHGYDEGNHQVRISRPHPYRGETLDPNQGVHEYAEEYWASDRWLTVRFHMKASTTATSDDGEFRVWLTDPDTGEIELIHELTGFSISYSDGITPDRIEGFSFAHNKDNGPPNIDMHIWWGAIRVWSSDPGWK